MLQRYFIKKSQADLNPLDRQIALPSEHLSIADHEERCGLNALNDYQVTAVRASLRRKFTLIQGPPGKEELILDEYELTTHIMQPTKQIPIIQF